MSQFKSQKLKCIQLNKSQNQHLSMNKAKRIKKNDRYRYKNNHKQMLVDKWNSFQNITYAKILLRYLIHSRTVDNYFFQTLAQILNKMQHQVYTYHCRMLNKFRQPQKIVLHFLNFTINGQSEKKPSHITLDFVNTTIESQIIEYQVQEIQIYLSENQKQFISNLFMIDKSPQFYEDNVYDFQAEIYDMKDFEYIINSQDQKI